MRAHPALLLLIVGAALALRIAVPAGFMPMLDDGRMIVGLCGGNGPARMVMEIPGLEHKSAGLQAEGGCAFSDLSLPSLAGAHRIPLAALIVFLLALGLDFAVAPAPGATLRLRPPLRGPPAHALR
ncbi:hypothetical protein [Sphingomonas sp. M1-B02]|uniref:hypothetical protein n=1 Tax=Sphingomonas sp. M1-B02 TaxID=3114300 RepID=UPI0022403F71|nr:hypothetical protein [Sphingomonas sp. S6-11]UZK67451.1 hypothetical protein OKW87_06355 [Sphingomonas sp. S6-11]